MDSTWFAVDADGNIAAFETGEGGCVPVGDFPMGGEAGGYSRDALETSGLLAHALLVRAESDQRLREMLPNSYADLEASVEGADSWEAIESLLRSVGVWTYGCDEPVATPYVRVGEPTSSLRIAQFGKALRKRFKKAKLPVRFADQDQIAPGEYGPVAAWGALWFDTKGAPHPTVDGASDFDREVAELDEHEFDWVAEPCDGEVHEGEEFYEAVAELLRPRENPAPESGGHPFPVDVAAPAGAGKGKRSWFSRLFRK